MYKRYFRKKDCTPGEKEDKWVEMTGREYYQFVTDAKNKGRHFIDMGDVVLEVTETEALDYKAEVNHQYYIKSQESGWSTVSLYTAEDKNGCSGEEVAVDAVQDVEIAAILRVEMAALQKAFAQLDTESCQLIYALYLSNPRKTLRQVSQESGLPVMTLQDRKKKILEFLRREMFKNF